MGVRYDNIFLYVCIVFFFWTFGLDFGRDSSCRNKPLKRFRPQMSQMRERTMLPARVCG